MLTSTRQYGLTLIELMIGIVIIGMLIVFGVPSYTTWIHNTQIRTGTEAIFNGMQLARAEAVRRNVSVQIVLAPPASTWAITEAVSGTAIQSRPVAEGSSTASVATTPGGATTLTFNSLGRVVANLDASASITQVDVTSTVAAADRPLRITINAGGNVRMCDPSPLLAATDPKAC